MDPQPIQQERDERIAALEKRLSRTSGVGVRLPVALLAGGVALVMLWMQRLDLAYFAAPRDPISLGREGEYRAEAALSNRYVQLHGAPTARGIWVSQRTGQAVVVGLRDSPFLVWRAPVAGEHWDGSGTPPQPNQAPFAVRGRLLSRDDAGRYIDAFTQMERLGEVKPRWLVLEGERPGGDLGGMAFAGVLAAFVALNAYFAYRELRVRLRR